MARRIRDIFIENLPNMGETVFGHWLPRMVVAGVDMNDVLRIRAKVRSWEDWPILWSEQGDKHLEMAEKAESGGHLVTAGNAYRRAALYYHYAHFMLFDRPELKEKLHDKSMAVMEKALKFIRFPGKKVYIPYGENRLPALLRENPEADGRMVFLMGGADANKEEMSTFADVFLERGLSVITVDCPGQGEAVRTMPYRKKTYDGAVDAVVKYIKQLGYTKLAVGGISFGGYLGPRAAAVNSEFKAAFGCGGPFDFRDIEKMGPLFYGDFGHVMGVETLEELFALRDEIDLSDVIGNLTCPLMIVHGTEDRIIEYYHAREIVEKSSSIEPNHILLEGANHVCNNYVYAYRPLIADWIVEKLK